MMIIDLVGWGYDTQCVALEWDMVRDLMDHLAWV